MIRLAIQWKQHASQNKFHSAAVQKKPVGRKRGRRRKGSRDKPYPTRHRQSLSPDPGGLLAILLYKENV